MNKVKTKVKKDFTIIPNGLINDNSLTDRARFLFCYMASKPEDWDFYQVPLSKQLGYSVETLRKYIKELLESGWMERQEKREQGKFDSYNYMLLPSPCGKNTDTVKNRHGKKPSRENLELYKKDFYKERDNTKRERENSPAKNKPDISLKTETPKEKSSAKKEKGMPGMFAPDAHNTAAEHLIGWLEENPAYLDGMEHGDWQRAVHGHCLKLQKLGEFFELQVPANENDEWRWLSKRLAGIKGWYAAAQSIDKNQKRNGKTRENKNLISEQGARNVLARLMEEEGRRSH